MTQHNIEQSIRTAIERHRAGRTTEAAAIYRQVLAVQPKHVDALCLLGMIARQEGRTE